MHTCPGCPGVVFILQYHSSEVRLRPVIDGGGQDPHIPLRGSALVEAVWCRCNLEIEACEQERGMRSGTLATPPIVGFGAAAEV